MTRLMQRTQRRYHVGIASVWGRCFGVVLAVALMATPAQTKEVNANTLAGLMAYCVSAMVSDNLKVSNRPADVQVNKTNAIWQQGRKAAMVLEQRSGDWDCTISSEDPDQMRRASQSITNQMQQAEVTTENWKNRRGKTVTASGCIARMRLTMVVNGPIGEGGNIGYARISNKFRKIRPC